MNAPADIPTATVAAATATDAAASGAASAAWTQIPERGNLFWMHVMAWLSLHAGRRPTRLILYAACAYFLLVSPQMRRHSCNYLDRALGRRATWRDSYRHVFSFASTIHDRIYFVTGRDDLFQLTPHGGDALLDATADGQGAFLIGAHLGSFEVLRAAARHRAGRRAVMLMHERNAQKIKAMLKTIDPHATQDVISLGELDSMLQVKQRLTEGWLIGMLADRAPVPDTLQRVSFLGKETALPTGPFRMAALLRSRVIFMTGLYLGGNHYALHFEPLADFSATTRENRHAAIADAVARYAELLDRYCRKAPYNWFNFFDFWQPPTPLRKAAP